MPNIQALCSLQLYLKPKTLLKVMKEAAIVLEENSPEKLPLFYTQHVPFQIIQLIVPFRFFPATLSHW